MDTYNMCIKCGKTRITVKEWTVEEPNGTTTKKSITVCPDVECQKAVEEIINEKTKERARKEQARQARLAKIHAQQIDSMMQQ